MVIFSIGLRLQPSFFIAGFLSMALGIFASPIVVSANTLLHEVMIDEMRGRIFSSLEIIMHIGFLVFMILTSLVAEWVDKELILVIIGLIFSVIGFVKLARGIGDKTETI